MQLKKKYYLKIIFNISNFIKLNKIKIFIMFIVQFKELKLKYNKNSYLKKAKNNIINPETILTFKIKDAFLILEK